ncbi:MAG TPA: DUF2189 domain-containing protein [Acetobacteraceae bacterium]|nr:DUF2189 domain-containing protein [Acetobacteraceae bacterium]
MAIRNPVVFTWDQVKNAAAAVDSAAHEDLARERSVGRVQPHVRRIGLADLRYALARGWEDFSADPTHYLFLCVLYPIVGIVLGRLAFGYEVLPLVFPLVTGFALVGPIAAIGIYEMSRRRETGAEVAWWHAFDVLRSPAIGAIVKLVFALAVIFVLWLVAAEVIYRLTLGSGPPASAGDFLHDVFTTPAGWTLIVVGNLVGFLFAVLVLTISVVSFQMLVDRDVTAEVALRTSVQVVRTSPLTIAAWGLTIAVILAIASVPLLLGLAVALPVLGHASWHLYRRVVTA